MKPTDRTQVELGAMFEKYLPHFEQLKERACSTLRHAIEHSEIEFHSLQHPFPDHMPAVTISGHATAAFGVPYPLLIKHLAIITFGIGLASRINERHAAVHEM